MGQLSLASIETDGSNGLNDAVLLRAQENELQENIAIKKFVQCISLYNERYINGKTFVEIAAIMGISQISVKRMVNIAKKFNLDKDKFIEYYKSVAPKTWRQIDSLINAPSSKKYNTNFAHIVKRIRKALRENIEPNSSEARQDTLWHIASLRDYIDRYMPKNVTTTSEELKYYDCCFCGKEAPDGGHRLKQDAHIAGMQYPLCDLCRSAGTPIDYQRVAQIYYTLYCELEDAFIQHTNAIIK